MRIFETAFGGLFARGPARPVISLDELRRRLRHHTARREAVDAEFTMIEDGPEDAGTHPGAGPGGNKGI